MKRTIYTFLGVLSMLLNPMTAKCDQAEPKSPLKRIYYCVSGGMLPGVQAYAELRREKDGRQLLTLNGDCMDEKVTFEVHDSVFQRCEELIRTTKVYLPAEASEPEMRVLDAPTMTFRVSYEDAEEGFSVSSDSPFEIRKGMRVITDYLAGLRGDRHAVGHLQIMRQSFDSTFNNTVWVNGDMTYEPDESGISELLEFLCDDFDMEYEIPEWEIRHAEGSGFQCMIVKNETQSFMEIFYDQKTVGHAVRMDEDIPGLYPQTARRLFTRAELDNLPTDTLKFMAMEMAARYGCQMPDQESQAYFDAQPWYKNKYYRYQRMSDIEEQNDKLIDYLLLWRRKHPEEDASE